MEIRLGSKGSTARLFDMVSNGLAPWNHGAYKGSEGKVGDTPLRIDSTSGIVSRYRSSNVVSISVGLPICGSRDRPNLGIPFHMVSVLVEIDVDQ